MNLNILQVPNNTSSANAHGSARVSTFGRRGVEQAFTLKNTCKILHGPANINRLDMVGTARVESLNAKYGLELDVAIGQQPMAYIEFLVACALHNRHRAKFHLSAPPEIQVNYINLIFPLEHITF